VTSDDLDEFGVKKFHKKVILGRLKNLNLSPLRSSVSSESLIGLPNSGVPLGHFLQHPRVFRFENHRCRVLLPDLVALSA
jgi:hypothetical protein